MEAKYSCDTQLIDQRQKSFDPCQPARAAQADMSRYLSAKSLAAYFSRRMAHGCHNVNSYTYKRSDMSSPSSIAKTS